MSIGKRIYETRIKLNMSQEQLAFEVGCSQDLISKLETGKRNKTSLILKFAKVLKVDANWLEKGVNEASEYTLTPQLEAHLKVMQQLPDYAREEVIRDAIKTVELISKATSAAKNNGTEK